MSYASRKGKYFEWQISNELSRILGVKFRRTPCSGGIHYYFESDLLKMGNKPTIVDNFILECKDQKTIKLLAWIKQVKEECQRADTKKWLLFIKVNGEAIVVQTLAQYEDILKQANEKLS
jgi:hypothetical protein